MGREGISGGTRRKSYPLFGCVGSGEESSNELLASKVQLCKIFVLPVHPPKKKLARELTQTHTPAEREIEEEEAVNIKVFQFV